MSSSATPVIVAGHYVRSPLLVSVGCNRGRMVYAVSPSTLATVDISGDGGGIPPLRLTDQQSSPSLGRKGSTGTYATVERPAEEVISFIAVHPERDVLCVGTENHGLYLTRASNPVLSKNTRLPLDISGERTYSGCFLHVPATEGPSATTSVAPTAGYAAPLKRNQAQVSSASGSGVLSSSSREQPSTATEEDVLVFSSTFKDKKGPNPHRLSLYALKEKCLLWRGAMDPLDSVCAFPKEWSFAACACSRISVFSVQWTAPPAAGGAQATTHDPRRGHNRSQRNKATLLSRLCSCVDELRGAEFVQCATDYYSGKKESTFLALTSNGYMVTLDRETGAVVRWMDGKVCPAHSVQIAGTHVLTVGSMLRFFTTDAWEFCGKIKPEVPSSIANSSYLGKLLNSTYTAAVPVSPTSVALFSGSGEAFVYRVAKVPGAADKGRGAGSKKIQLQQLMYYAPVSAAERDFLWVRPTLLADAPAVGRRKGEGASTDIITTAPHTATWCLWSPSMVRVYSQKLALRKALTLETKCAAYHSGSQVLLVYDGSNCEVVAYAGTDDWRAWARMDLAEPLACMAASPSSDMCAGYSERDSTLAVFMCAWKQIGGDASSRSLTLQRSWSMTLPCPSGCTVRQLFFMGGTKIYAVTERSLIEAESGAEHPLTSPASPAPVLKACPVGLDVLVLFQDRCAYYVPDTHDLRTLVLRMPAPSLAASDGNAGEVNTSTGEDILDGATEGLVDVAYEPVCDLVAVSDAHRVVVARLLDSAVISVVEHDPTPRGQSARPRGASAHAQDDRGEEGGENSNDHDVLRPVQHQEIKSVDLRAGATNVVLSIIDTLGHVTEYAIEDKKIEFNMVSPRGSTTPRGTARHPTTPPSRSAPRRMATAADHHTAGRTPPASKGKIAPPRTATTTPAPATRAMTVRPRGRGRPELPQQKAAAKTRAKTVAATEERRPRQRAVSVHGPSNRELEDRFEALTGFYEQQKVHSQQLPARTPRRSSAPNAAQESTPDFPQTATPVDSHDVSALPVVVEPLHFDASMAAAGLRQEADSPPPARVRTAKRGVAFEEDAGEAPLAGADVGTGAGTSMAVSALTVPSSSTDFEDTGRGEGLPTNQAAPQPQPCDRSPMRHGDAPPEPYVPQGDDEVRHSSSVRGAHTSSPHEPSGGAAVPISSLEGGTSAAQRGLPPLASLRDSLMHLKDMLEAGDASTEELATTPDAERQWAELPPLLEAVAAALRQRQGRHTPPSPSHTAGPGVRTAAGTVAEDHGAPSLRARGAEAESYQFLFAELQRIQKQNERLEEQNRAIMSRLEPDPKDRA